VGKILKSSEFLDSLVVEVFQKNRQWVNRNLGKLHPVRLRTCMIVRSLANAGYNFSLARVRSSCKRLSGFGILEADKTYSAVNSISWRYTDE
jgi:hypothetical protein